MAKATRVITKNLLASAIHALHGAPGSVKMSDIENLCTLLNVSMLNRAVRTLGNQDEKHKPHLKLQYGQLAKDLDLEVDLSRPDSAQLASIAKLKVQQHSEEWPEFRSNDGASLDLEAQLKSCIDASTSEWPDHWEDFQEGIKLFSAGAKSDAAKFVLRSFIYWALAIAEDAPMVIDAVRVCGLRLSEDDSPRDEIRRLEAAIAAKYYSLAARRLPEYERISNLPAAVVVLVRARGDRSNILKAAREVRNEIAPSQSALEAFVGRMSRQYRSDKLFGTAHGVVSRDEALADYDEALREFRERKLPLPPAWYTWEPVWKLASASLDLMKAIPKIPARSFAYLTDLLRQSASLESSQRAFAAAKPVTKGDFMEIHRVVGFGLFAKADVDLEKMFGRIEQDRSGASSPLEW